MTQQHNLRLILVGLPGSGKGTQADFIKKKYDIFHISTGNLLREAINNATLLGKQAQAYVKSGELVPDNLIINLVKEEITKNNNSKGFVLDGFPRNLPQAKKLDKMLEELNKALDLVIEIKLDEEILIKRLTGRRTCSKCGRLYNIYFNPPKASDICNICRERLSLREDDKIDVVKNRIKVYWSNISPMIDYYKHRELLYIVNGEYPPDRVFADICKIIDKL